MRARTAQAPASPGAGNPLAAKGLAFLGWLLLALSACFWGLRFAPGPATNDAPPVAYTPPAPADPVALARVFGPDPAPVAAAVVAAAPVPTDNLVLQGVVAGRTAHGVALIAMNGKPARPYRVGGRIEDRYVLHSVAARSAVLARADNPDTRITLDLAPPSAPTSVGTAPALGNLGGGGSAIPPAPFTPPAATEAPARMRPPGIVPGTQRQAPATSS